MPRNARGIVGGRLRQTLRAVRASDARVPLRSVIARNSRHDVYPPSTGNPKTRNVTRRKEE